jgi:hypothetical protein
MQIYTYIYLDIYILKYVGIYLLKHLFFSNTYNDNGYKVWQ